MTRARALLTVGESDRVAFLLEQALAQWRGPAFVDLRTGRPRAARPVDWTSCAWRRRRCTSTRCCAAGAPREVLALAHSLVRAAPRCASVGGSSSSWRSTRPARRARRCAHCASSAAVLARELGIDPSPEMLALEQSILQQDPRLLVPQQRASTAQCPWQGLKAYDVDDTERFFGRDADVDACLAILRRGARSSPSWGPPGPASPRSCARACSRPCVAVATGSS